MAKSRKLEDLLAALSQIRDDPTSEAGLAVLHQVLKGKYSVAVAQAAGLISQYEIHSFIPDLVSAFDRFMVNAKESDPGCRAKQAISETLYRLDYSDEALFLKGIRHVQEEPVWGGRVDTAPSLRGTCALGLVRMNYPLVMVELGDLLADPESEARIGAARAVAYTQNDQGVPLLRLRVKIGDTSQVLSECLIALLQLAPDQSLPLVKDLLYAQKLPGLEEDVDKAEAAALALSESRLPQAFSILKPWWKGVHDLELRKTGLLAIATLRQPNALEFLLSLIAEGQPQDAIDAIKAMGVYVQDKVLWQRVCQTAEERQDVDLKPFLEKVSKSMPT
jgi:hypothetical protein